MFRTTSTSRRRSYTLIELLMVVGILGLSSTLLIPYLVNRETMAIQAAVRQVVADITFAQTEALTRQGYRRVQFYEDGSGYCLLEVEEDALGETFDPDAAVYVNDPAGVGNGQSDYIMDFTADDDYQNISIESAVIDDDKLFLTFDPLGGTVTSAGTPGTGGSIIISNTDGDSYQITIAAFTGKLTVQKLDTGE